jgi:zinc transport system substrate-binding protein
MTKKIFTSMSLLLVLMFGIFTFAACGNQKTNNKLSVYASFYPLYDFARKIGGDKVEVNNLVQPGQEAHHYEPTAKQMVGMAQADLIIINGVQMESWIEELSANIKNKTLDTSQGVTLIERTKNSDNQHIDDGHDEDEHIHGADDPHIWLSIKNAKIQMENIKNKFVALDSKNKDYYQENYERYAFLFDLLDSAYQQELSTLANRNIIVSHRAFGYIANDYNLIQYSLSGIESDTDPTPTVMAEIKDFILENNIKAIFYQTFANSKVAELIAGSTSAKLYKLSTLESLTKAEMENGEDYLSIMAQNLMNLKKAIA